MSTEWNAQEYAQRSSLQQVMAAKILERLELGRNEQILDIGCGNGKITAEIAERVPQGTVLGVDPSQNMIRFALETFGDRQNLHFEVGDARYLSYQQRFDLVVSFNALHWVPEQDLALQSLHRALKPTGRAILRFVAKGDRPSIEATLEEIRQRPQWRDYFQGFKTPFLHLTPDAYQKLAIAQNLVVIDRQLDTEAWDFKTRDAFVAFCLTTCVAWTQHLPADRHVAFITEVLDRYQTIAANCPTENNTFKFYQLSVKLCGDGSP
jgi:trans-aconitate methyltransferase